MSSLSAWMRDNWPWIAGLLPVISTICAAVQRKRLSASWRSWRDTAKANARSHSLQREIEELRISYESRLTNLNQALIEKDQRITSLAAALEQLVQVGHLIRAEVDAGHLTTSTDSSTSPASSTATLPPSS